MAEGKNLVGVDIGSSSIKVCQLKETRKGFSLAKMAYAPLPPQTVVDGHVMNSGVVVETLAKVFHDNKIKQRDVAMSVSTQSVIIRRISLPIMNAAELDEHIPWESKQHIPFDLKEMQLDYEVLRRRPETGQMDVLLVAAKKEEINDHANLAREAKLKPVVVDIDAFTVQNMFENVRGLPTDQTIALINIGASISSLNIVSNGATIFPRDVPTGGNAITEQLQKQLGIPIEQAEAYKSATDETGLLSKSAVSIIRDAADGVAGEIQRSIDFFLATNGDIELSKIFVTGGSANLPQLCSSLERRSGVGVEVFLPTEKLTIEPKEVDPKMVSLRAAQMSVALGLALRKDKEKRT
ncbi:MAG: type IV pilus assembly protein PilM [Polyangiaceae bacterium]